MIPHKVLNIRGYICTYLALFFIFVFIRLLEYQILQFHAYFLSAQNLPVPYYIAEFQKSSRQSVNQSFLSRLSVTGCFL